MRIKKANPIFICQICENTLKVVKCLPGYPLKILGLDSEAISPDKDEKGLTEKLRRILQRLGYLNHTLLVCLPRNLATCRLIKVPSQMPQEIERIISLQASTYLPYPANELISAYQVISSDKTDYTHVNLIIAHKDVIEQYLTIFKELKVSKFGIVLSSYGLCNLYNYAQAQESEPVMLIDQDVNYVELAIISKHKLLFSRYFKLKRLEPNWENLFINEVKKTGDLYLKEVSKQPPHKLVFLGANTLAQDSVKVLNERVNLPVEVLAFHKNISASEGLLNKLANSTSSFASLIGLGLEPTEESLNILPSRIKEKERQVSLIKERLRTVVFVCAIFLIWGLALAKNLDNKTKYLALLEAELNKIKNEAKPLEDMEKRMQLLERRSSKRADTLDIICEIYKIIPGQVFLNSLNYEDDTRLTLRGQTQELNSIFTFVSQIEKSPVFKNFSIKVKYATKKRTALGEVVDFEINCVKSIQAKGG